MTAIDTSSALPISSVLDVIKRKIRFGEEISRKDLKELKEEETRNLFHSVPQPDVRILFPREDLISCWFYHILFILFKAFTIMIIPNLCIYYDFSKINHFAFHTSTKNSHKTLLLEMGK